MLTRSFEETITIMLEFAFSTGIIVGPILGYIPQYFEIRKTKQTEKFSTVVCFILLTSNVLRILWFFLLPFPITLLVQSIVMILAQICLLELIVRLKRQKLKIEGGGRRLLKFRDCIV